MRILALDIGEKRIGMAISDEMNITAQGLEFISAEEADKTMDRIKSIVEEYNVKKIVAGLPLNMDGSHGKSANMVKAFVSKLKERLDVEIDTIDERLTSAQGERLLLEADVSRKKRKKSLDKIAAQLILQNYLDLYAQKNQS